MVKLTRLVNRHPRKQDFLEGITNFEDQSISDFNVNIRKLDPDLRYTLVNNICNARNLTAAASHTMDSVIDDLTKQLLPALVPIDDKKQDILKNYEWKEADEHGENILDKEGVKWRLDFEKAKLHEEEGHRSLNQIIHKARELDFDDSNEKFDMETKILLARSIIESHQELLHGEEGWRTPIPGQWTPPTLEVVEKTAELIGKRLDERVNSVTQDNHAFPFEGPHLSNIYYLWAAGMVLSREPSVRGKLLKAFSNFSLRYPHFPIITTDKKGNLPKKFNSDPNQKWTTWRSISYRTIS